MRLQYRRSMPNGPAESDGRVRRLFKHCSPFGSDAKLSHMDQVLKTVKAINCVLPVMSACHQSGRRLSTLYEILKHGTSNQTLLHIQKSALYCKLSTAEGNTQSGFFLSTIWTFMNPPLNTKAAFLCSTYRVSFIASLVVGRYI